MTNYTKWEKFSDEEEIKLIDDMEIKQLHLKPVLEAAKVSEATEKESRQKLKNAAGALKSKVRMMNTVEKHI